MPTDLSSPGFLASLSPCFPDASVPPSQLFPGSSEPTLPAFPSPPSCCYPMVFWAVLCTTLNSFTPGPSDVQCRSPWSLPNCLTPIRFQLGRSSLVTACHSSTAPVSFRVVFSSLSVPCYLSALVKGKHPALFTPMSSALPQCPHRVGAQ